MRAFLDRLMKYIVVDDQVCAVSNIVLKADYLTQAYRIVDNPFFRELLMYSSWGRLEEKDIPHRTKMRDLILNAYHVEYEALKTELKVKALCSFSCKHSTNAHAIGLGRRHQLHHRCMVGQELGIIYGCDCSLLLQTEERAAGAAIAPMRLSTHRGQSYRRQPWPGVRRDSGRSRSSPLHRKDYPRQCFKLRYNGTGDCGGAS